MVEYDWTSKQQDILEDLNAGNAGSLVAYLIEGGSVSGTPGGRPKDEYKVAELARSYTVEAVETLVDLYEAQQRR